MKQTALILALCLAVGPAVFGGMVFEKNLIEIKAGADADLVTADFKFTITGDAPVTISEYEAACSCLSAEISGGGKLVWEPGESGVVKSKFKMGTFKGTVDKHIVLRLKGQLQPERLTVRVTIPVLFEIEPQTLFWDQNGAGATKRFRMQVKHDKPIKVTDVSGTNENFSFQLKTLKAGWDYEIEVTPKTVAERAFGLLRIRTDAEFKRHQSAQAFVVVRRPKVVPVPAPK